MEAFVAEGPLVLGVDETLERRRGAKKIHAKGSVATATQCAPATNTSSKRVLSDGFA